MYKNLMVIFLLCSSLDADLFENNCLSCHGEGQLSMFISKYTLEYSSKKKILNAMSKYLTNPSSETSLMPRGFLNRFGLKEKTTLDKATLEKALQIYYQKYSYSTKLY